MNANDILIGLNEPKLSTKTGVFPAFFAVLQTAINSTSWKGSDLEMVSLVKGKLEHLRQACAEAEAAQLASEAPAEEQPEAPAEEEVGVEIGVPDQAPQVADPAHSAPANDPFATPAPAAPATDEKKN